jgi:hypothetical protein
MDRTIARGADLLDILATFQRFGFGDEDPRASRLAD